MTTSSPRARLLFVHAHPDDETLATGLAMAQGVADGHDVHLLTCTLGEEGEVIPPALTHLLEGDRLGPYRRGELRRAMESLGVTVRVLGEDPVTETGSAFRDSGMVGTAANRDPRSWVRADEGEAVAAVRAHIEALEPDVVVTYDEHGGYGHPDHIAVHERTVAAVRAIEPARRPALFAVLTPRDAAVDDRAWVAAHVPRDAGLTIPAADDPFPPSVVDPALVTHEVAPAPEVIASRDRALREHETQVSVRDGHYALSNDIAARLTRREGFALLDPDTGRLVPGDPATGRVRGLVPPHGQVGPSGVTVGEDATHTGPRR